MLTCECPRCDQPIEIEGAEAPTPDELYGRRVACASCGQSSTFGIDADGDLALIGMVPVAKGELQ